MEAMNETTNARYRRFNIQRAEFLRSGRDTCRSRNNQINRRKSSLAVKGFNFLS
jgi:hypothetical protein